MSCERLCGPQKQPCPTPYLCGTDCNFNCAEAAYTKAAEKHFEPDYGNPGYTHTLIEPPALEVEDSSWPLDWRGAVMAFVVVLVAFAFAYGATK
jgi:hypothetical protein